MSRYRPIGPSVHVPRDFFTTRRSTRRPYRGYTYGRRRTTSSGRSFIPMPNETELWWMRGDSEERPQPPTVPETPSVPTVPDTPSVPTVPETPSVPTVPVTPSVPTVPVTPSVPTVPVTPSVPTVPVTPSVPTVPETPSVPTLPETPSVPTDTPSVPSVPTIPSVPTLPEVTEAELATKLHVRSLDLHIEENTASHHTNMYDSTEEREVDGDVREAELFVRRGQEFTMTIRFDRPYDIRKNDITFVFQLGDEKVWYRTLVEYVKLDERASMDRLDKSKWGATILEKKDKEVKVSVHTPASAPVGRWSLSVRTIVDVVNEIEDIIWEYHHNNDIVLLFNPWCKEDLVYLRDETWLNETLLSDSGAIYFGSFKSPSARKWVFGQFEENVFNASLYLLEKVFGFDATPAMGNVIRVVRALSKIVNANDDAGVLIGKWGDDYEGGTKPSVWGGSIKILEEYLKTKSPVKYGQCWVFSGVLTAVCRSLGIPCRSVTNFESAHNSDNEHLSCDVINQMAFNGMWYEEKIDSIWNFHVWNEVWLSRPDLEGSRDISYDGWQVIDATPQETSEGVFQCGPSPLSAIKEGNIFIGSDTAFIFAEVNGDKVDWKLDPKTDVLIQVKRVKNAIGKKISTHKPTGKPYTGRSSYERLDITNLYKYDEGTAKEREIVEKAEKLFRFANYETTGRLTVIEAIDISIFEKEVHLGSPINFRVVTKNRGDVRRTVSLSLEVLFTTYRGTTTDVAAEMKTPEFTLGPEEDKETTITVDVETSIKRPQDGYNFKLVAIAETKESGNISKQSSKVRLIEPKIQVEGPERCKGGDEIDVVLSFTNPLPKSMTNCRLYIEGTLKPVAPTEDMMKIGDIRAGETWSKSIRLKAAMKPRYRKVRDASFDISCVQMGTVTGEMYVDLE